MKNLNNLNRLRFFASLTLAQNDIDEAFSTTPQAPLIEKGIITKEAEK